MKRLTLERQAHGWSKAELGRRASMNDSTVGQIENGVLLGYPSQVRKLATALGWGSDPKALLEEVSADAS